MASQSWSMAQVTDLLTSTAEISNLMSVVVVLAGLLVMLVFLLKLIYQVRTQDLSYACVVCTKYNLSRIWRMEGDPE